MYMYIYIYIYVYIYIYICVCVYIYIFISFLKQQQQQHQRYEQHVQQQSSLYASHQYGGQQYGMPSGKSPAAQWPSGEADKSIDSIPPEAFQAPLSGFSGDASADTRSPGQVNMHDFPHYQQQRPGKQQEMPPIALRSNAPHAQRSAAPPPPLAHGPDAGEMRQAPRKSEVDDDTSLIRTQYLTHQKSELDDDTSLIRTEADKIAQRLLKTEKELERLKKQGDLIGESLRKQKALDFDPPTPTLAATHQSKISAEFEAKQWGQIDPKPSAAPRPHPNEAPLPIQRVAAPTVQRAAALPPQRAAIPEAYTKPQDQQQQMVGSALPKSPLSQQQHPNVPRSAAALQKPPSPQQKHMSQQPQRQVQIQQQEQQQQQQQQLPPVTYLFFCTH